MSEYTLDIYIIRTGLDYHSDIFDKLVVNGETQDIKGEAWTTALRDWVNLEFKLNTRARSMTSIESVLRDAGYLIGFVEQDYLAPSTIVRRYKIKPIPNVQDRYQKRHRIVREASDIIAIAIGDNAELDMARQVEAACEQILQLIAEYEGHQVARYLQPTAEKAIADPMLADEISSLRVGDQVRMSKGMGGIGTIAEFDRENRTIAVDFPDRGRKFSVIDFCKFLISIENRVTP